MSAGYWLLTALGVVFWLWLIKRLFIDGDFIGDDPDDHSNPRRPW